MNRIKLAVLIIGGILTPILISYAMFPVIWEAEKPEARSLHIERTIGIGDVSIGVAIADTSVARERGLSGVERLAKGEGILFIFQDDGLHSFWMKGMLFSIDILWISSEKRVVHIEKNVSPESYPQSFTPPTRARYVLEVPSGFATEHEIEVGSKLEFSL